MTYADEWPHSPSCFKLTLLKLALLRLNAIQQRLYIDSKTVKIRPSTRPTRFCKIKAVGGIGNGNVSSDGPVDDGSELILNEEADIVDDGLVLGDDEGRHNVVNKETVRVAGSFSCQRRKIQVDVGDDCKAGENCCTNHASRRRPR